jgi:hypothetical protein
MKLSNIEELEFIQGKKINTHSTLFKAGVLSLKKKGLIREENFEKVVDLGELIIELHTLSKMLDKRNKNNNNPKGL